MPPTTPTLALLDKLDRFHGESRFATWASRFAILEVAHKIDRHLWRAEGIRLGAETLEWRGGSDAGPGRDAEAREILARVRRAVAEELSERQRRVFEAIVLDEVPLELLTAELDSNRGTIYKTLFGARRKLRAALVADELIAPDVDRRV